MVRDILLLGNPALYEKSQPVLKEEFAAMHTVVQDLHDTLMDYRARHGAGRAIAAPQIGVAKRLIYMCIDEPVVFVNPSITFPDEEKMTLLDDCMSFPHLLVEVERYKQCTVRYEDLSGKAHMTQFEGDLAELIQHEYDHLDGILATMRAVDTFAFVAK